jgi:WD40 repeat protein
MRKVSNRSLARWIVGTLLAMTAVAMPAGGAVLAQEASGWFGADMLDVSKTEADTLGWDAPHGAKLGVVASGSPAEKGGLKSGDIILSIDRIMLDTSSEVDAAIAAKHPGSVLRLQVLSGGRERRVALTLAERPKAQAMQQRAIPLLMLDTGGHMAAIKDIAFTPDAKQLVSAGDDKVIRIWDWREGVTIRTIRGLVGTGDEGKIYALALSPDGRWLAAGGWLSGTLEEICAIRLYDFATGNLVALLKGHSNVVFGLAFSPDGKRLISGSGDNTAIIWDVDGHSLVRRLDGHKNHIYAVAFTPDGLRAVTGSDDATLRLWSANDGGLIAVMQGHTKVIGRALAIRSSDSMIASGDATGEIRLWDGTTGRYLRTLTNQGGLVGSLRFSTDGMWLLSACGYGGGCNHTQRVWMVATGKELVAYAKHDNVVTAAAVSPSGNLAATGGGNGDVQVWDLKTGETKRVLAGTGAPYWTVGISADGQRIAWGHSDACPQQTACPNQMGQLQLQLSLPGAGQNLGRPERIAAARAQGFLRARSTYAGNALSHRKGGAYGYNAILDLKKDGQTRASIERGSTDGYAHRSYSFTPDGQTIISGGGNGSLSAYDLRGERIGNFVGHEGDVFAVTPSPDGRLLLSGSSDQTIRLWNLKTGELIVTLFDGSDGEWVMWTPQGYYAGSPGADQIVGWQINRGPDQVAEYVGAAQLRQHLNRPDIVVRAIILASAEQAVREAPGTTFQLADLLSRPIPRFKILSPLSDTTGSGGRAAVAIAIAATPDPIKTIRLQVNGRQIKELTPEIGSGGFASGEQLLDVPLAKGRNEVRVALTNAIGEKAATISVFHEGEGDLDKRGTLYIIAIGVDKYPGLGNSCGTDGHGSCDLAFSGADARALVAAAEKRLAPSHTTIVKRVLVNGAGAADSPTVTNVLDAVDLLKQAKENDTVLLFIAGHGINDGPNYRFLPTNAEWVGGGLRGATVVPWQILQEAVETAKGRRILLVDTCHAGNAYNQRLGNAAYHANIIAYTAARFDQLALESAQLGHGIFTYAVIEALDGEGALKSERQISTKQLANYVIKRVEQLAKTLNGEQEPQYFKGRDAEDYVLAHW